MPRNTRTTLTVEEAEVLASQSDYLELDELTSISVEVAKALTRHSRNLEEGEGELSLGGIRSLSEDVAAALAEYNGQYLRLDGLQTLSAEAAGALVAYEGYFSLQGLTVLSPEVVEAVGSKLTGQDRDFPNVSCISVEVAQALVDESRKELLNPFCPFRALHLNGLTTLTAEVASVLAQYLGEISLDGLSHIDWNVANALAKHDPYPYQLAIRGPCHLSLAGLKTASCAAIAALEGHLSLDHLLRITITPEP